MPSWIKKEKRRYNQESTADITKVIFEKRPPPLSRFPSPEPGESVWFDNFGTTDPPDIYVLDSDEVSEYSEEQNNNKKKKTWTFRLCGFQICLRFERVSRSVRDE